MSESENSIPAEDSGEDLPEYANESNKQINHEIKEKAVFVSRFSEEIEEIADRVKILQDHLKNVIEELTNTQKLVDTENRQIDSEDHLKQLSERQIGRLYSELQRLEQETADQQDRLNSVQNQIFKGNEKLDQYKLEMNWNQEELEQWALASRQKEDDNLTLEKYRRADEAKIKELSLHIESLTLQVRSKQDELDREVTETQAKQIELDKTAEEFKREHSERQVLYERLQKLVVGCRRLDSSLTEAAESFGKDRFRIRNKQELLAQKVKNQQGLQAEKQKTESDITLTQRQFAAKRLEEIQTKQELENFRGEVEITRNQLSALASDLAGKRAQIIALNTELAQRKQRLEEAHKKATQTRQRLRTECAQTENLEANAKQAQELHKECENDRDKLEREIRDLKVELFKQTQKLLDLRGDEANLLGEIKGALAAGRNLQAAINKLDQEIQQQHSRIYNTDYQIQSMQRRVDEAKGVQVTDKTKELMESIELKERVLTEKEEQLEKVSKSVKQLNDDLRLVERTIEDKQYRERVLQSAHDELQLQITMIETEIDKEMKKNNEVLVQHDSMKLEVKKLKDTLCNEADHLFSVENRKYQLQMSMEEREKEINVHKETLLAEKRAAEEEKHKVLVELASLKSKVNNLRVKYENLCYKNRNSEDGQERTQAYYVIKAAQEREELQRYGDELDAKIKKAEREIRALSNTLDHLKGRNSKFRDKFISKGNDNELQVKEALEEQCKGATEQLSRKERELRVLQKQYEDDINRLNEMQTAGERMAKTVAEALTAKQELTGAIEQQRTQLERALKTAQSRETELSELQNLDLNVVLLKTKNRCMLSALSALLQDIPELRDVLTEPLAQYGVRVPSRPPSSRSSRS